MEKKEDATAVWEAEDSRRGARKGGPGGCGGDRGSRARLCRTTREDSLLVGKAAFRQTGHWSNGSLRNERV